MKNTAFLKNLVVALAAALLLGSAGAALASGARLEVTPARTDITMAVTEAVPPGSYQVRNLSSQSVTVAVTTNASWLVLSPLSFTLSSGATQIVNYSASTPGVGTHRARIYFSTSSGSGTNAPRVAIEVKFILRVMSSPTDLEVSGFSVDPASPGPGEPFRVQALISNRGAEPSDSFGIRWRVNGNDFYSGTHPALAGGAASGDYTSFLNFRNGRAAGDYTIELSVDPEDNVSEPNEANNTAFQTFQVGSGNRLPKGVIDGLIIGGGTGHGSVGPSSVIFGWAVDDDNPTQAVQVEVVVDGTVRATETANVSRPDVVYNDWAPNPEHGFVVQLSRLGLTPGRHTIGVQATDAQTGERLALRGSGRELVINTPPVPESVSPASGTSKLNQYVTFTATYSDVDGASDLEKLSLLVNESPSTANGVSLIYVVQSNTLYMHANDGESGVGRTCIPGQRRRAYLQNSYGKLACHDSSVLVSGNTVTVNWRVVFKRAFQPKVKVRRRWTSPPSTKKVYVSAEDTAGAWSGWVEKGSWTIG